MSIIFGVDIVLGGGGLAPEVGDPLRVDITLCPPFGGGHSGWGGGVWLRPHHAHYVRPLRGGHSGVRGGGFCLRQNVKVMSTPP